MYELCLFLITGSLYCLLNIFIFLFENDQNKSQRRQRITNKFGLTDFNAKNKYSLFGRILPIAIIILMNNKFMNHDISTREKYLLKKLFISSFSSIIQFNFISFHSYKNYSKILIEKFIFQIRQLQFYKKGNPFAGIPVLFLLYRNTSKI